VVNDWFVRGGDAVSFAVVDDRFLDSRVSRGGVRANYFGAAQNVYRKLTLREAHST
jgi:hypothetical protein